MQSGSSTARVVAEVQVAMALVPAAKKFRSTETEMETRSTESKTRNTESKVSDKLRDLVHRGGTSLTGLRHIVNKLVGEDEQVGAWKLQHIARERFHAVRRSIEVPLVKGGERSWEVADLNL